MSLLPSITIAEFKKLKASEIARLKAIEVTSDGSYLFTAIIPHSDPISSMYIKTQAEYLGVKANIVGGLDPEELKEKALASV